MEANNLFGTCVKNSFLPQEMSSARKGDGLIRHPKPGT
jgi:hypothetical protein